MRVHFLLATVVLVLAFAYDVTKVELMALLISISFVLFAEMINTAVEEMIDLSTKGYDPRAKIAKDVAAGRGARSPSVVAATIGYLVFVDRIRSPTYHLINEVRAIPANLTIIALALTVIAVIAVKAISGRGTPLSGGLPSGHAAVAFGGLDGDHARLGRLPAPRPRLDARVPDGVPRRPDAGRVGHPLDRARSRSAACSGRS